MLKYKGIGKAAACLLLAVACLFAVSPVSAFTDISVTTNSSLTELPAEAVETPATNGHLVSLVRYSASSSATIIGCMENGTKLTVLGSKGSFYKIDCYDMKGYIAKTQVIKDDNGDYYVRAVENSSESKYLNSYSTQEAMQLQSSIVKISKKYIGVKYLLGGSTPKAFDCSGYVQYVFREAGISINRTVRTQLQNGVIIAKEDLQPGDLVTFSNTGDGSFASHVGLYLGNGKLIHCGESRGVCIVDLDSTYFAKHYQCARRVIITDVAMTASLPTVAPITGSIGSDWRNDG